MVPASLGAVGAAVERNTVVISIGHDYRLVVKHVRMQRGPLALQTNRTSARSVGKAAAGSSGAPRRYVGK